MKTKTMIFTGDMPDGYVQDPVTGQTFPFVRGVAVVLPGDVADALIKQGGDWSEVLENPIVAEVAVN